MNKIKYKPIPTTCGALFTLERFIENCKDGGFIDYDGFGYYAFKDKISNKVVRPSDITGKYSIFNEKTEKFDKKTKPINIDRRFTHVMWFNR